MSDYFDFDPNEYDPQGEDNPFAGLPGFDDSEISPDPYEQVERDVLDSFGVESFEDIIFDVTSVQPDDLRGNRFATMSDALNYLFDAGILRFSGVVLQGDEILIEVDSESP